MAKATDSFFEHLLSSLPLSSIFSSPKKASRNRKQLCTHTNFSLFFLSLLLSLFFFTISILRFIPASLESTPCSSPSISPVSFPLASLFSVSSNNGDERRLTESEMVPLPARGVLVGNISDEEREFWKQPDGEGYRPCLDFSIQYRRESAKISKEKRRFLVVALSGGLNQQRNQIVDAVVIARILEAALVVPVLQVNMIWKDESEFSEIFDVEHFKRTLQADVRVVSSLPSTHLASKQSIQSKIPHDVSAPWIRARFLKQLKEEKVLVLKGLDSKLSKNLSPDLQKLRCKVAFHALRFTAPIQELGNQLARRMWIEGPYIGLHLRLEKDVWVRTGCLTGLGSKYDNIIATTRESQPEYLANSKFNTSNIHRRFAGLCPLSALEITRLLKALGVPRNAGIYIAGGEPFGGKEALQPLAAEFPNIVTKYMLAREGELSPYINKSSALAAIDYIVSLNSDVFMPSHGGNMGRLMQGHRAYAGHRKYIKPNKRAMVPLFENASISEAEKRDILRKLHIKCEGQPEARTNRKDRDVIAYPVPECMCKQKSISIF